MYLSHATYLKMAVGEAFHGLKERGPMEGAVLVLDGMVAGRSRRRSARNGHHAFAACMAQAGPLTARELARSTLYLNRTPCPLCWESIIRYGIPLVVLPVDDTHQEGGAPRPELIYIQLEDEGGDARWRHIPGGVCAVDLDDNH